MCRCGAGVIVSTCTVSTRYLWNTPEGEMSMATVKTFLIAASCGMILLGAVSAHAKIAANKIAANKLNMNDTSLIGTNPSEGLPFNGLSQSGLGKPSVEPRTP